MEALLAPGPAPRGPTGRRRSGPRSKSSPYIGVTQYKRTGRFEAHVWIVEQRGAKGHQRHLGSYATAEEAARSYDRAVLRLRGIGAVLNFPIEDYAEDPFIHAYGHLEQYRYLEMLRAQFAMRSERTRAKAAQPGAAQGGQARGPAARARSGAAPGAGPTGFAGASASQAGRASPDGASRLQLPHPARSPGAGAPAPGAGLGLGAGGAVRVSEHVHGASFSGSLTGALNASLNGPAGGAREPLPGTGQRPARMASTGCQSASAHPDLVPRAFSAPGPYASAGLVVAPAGTQLAYAPLPPPLAEAAGAPSPPPALAGADHPPPYADVRDYTTPCAGAYGAQSVFCLTAHAGRGGYPPVGNAGNAAAPALDAYPPLQQQQQQQQQQYLSEGGGMAPGAPVDVGGYAPFAPEGPDGRTGGCPAGMQNDGLGSLPSLAPAPNAGWYADRAAAFGWTPAQGRDVAGALAGRPEDAAPFAGSASMAPCAGPPPGTFAPLAPWPALGGPPPYCSPQAFASMPPGHAERGSAGPSRGASRGTEVSPCGRFSPQDASPAGRFAATHAASAVGELVGSTRCGPAQPLPGAEYGAQSDAGHAGDFSARMGGIPHDAQSGQGQGGGRGHASGLTHASPLGPLVSPQQSQGSFSLGPPAMDLAQSLHQTLLSSRHLPQIQHSSSDAPLPLPARRGSLGGPGHVAAFSSQPGAAEVDASGFAPQLDMAAPPPAAVTAATAAASGPTPPPKREREAEGAALQEAADAEGAAFGPNAKRPREGEGFASGAAAPPSPLPAKSPLGLSCAGGCSPLGGSSGRASEDRAATHASADRSLPALSLPASSPSSAGPSSHITGGDVATPETVAERRRTLHCSGSEGSYLGGIPLDGWVGLETDADADADRAWLGARAPEDATGAAGLTGLGGSMQGMHGMMHDAMDTFAACFGEVDGPVRAEGSVGDGSQTRDKTSGTASPAAGPGGRVLSPSDVQVGRVISPADVQACRVLSPADVQVGRVISPADDRAVHASGPATASAGTTSPVPASAPAPIPAPGSSSPAAPASSPLPWAEEPAAGGSAACAAPFGAEPADPSGPAERTEPSRPLFAPTLAGMERRAAGSGSVAEEGPGLDDRPEEASWGQLSICTDDMPALPGRSDEMVVGGTGA